MTRTKRGIAIEEESVTRGFTVPVRNENTEFLPWPKSIVRKSLLGAGDATPAKSGTARVPVPVGLDRMHKY
jgi:hypothetical protein